MRPPVVLIALAVNFVIIGLLLGLLLSGKEFSEEMLWAMLAVGFITAVGSLIIAFVYWKQGH